MLSFSAYADDAKLWSVSDITELKRVKPGNNRLLNRFDGDLAIVEDIDSLGTIAAYRFSKTSSATADDTTVVAPNIGNGRWIMVMSSNYYLPNDDTKGTRLHIARSTYSFADDGGAIGNITLDGDVLPEKAVPTVCYYFVDTALTSATNAGKIALSYKYNGSSYVIFKAAEAVSSIGTAGMKSTLIAYPSDGSTRTKVSTGSGAGSFMLAISVEALTAGKLTLVCEYIIGQ